MPIKGVKVLDLDEVEIGLAGAIEEADDLLVRDGAALGFTHEAGAPVVGAESFFKAVGVDLCAAIGEGEHLEAAAVEGFEFLTEFDGIAISPIKEDVDADQFLFLRRVRFQSLMEGFVGFARIDDGLELFGLFAHASDDGFGEFLRADLLFAGALLEDVVRVDAFFEGAEPGVVNEFGDVGLTDVDEHEDATEEEAGGIGEVLSGAAGGGTVDGFEHGAAIADVGGPGKADRPGDLGGDVGEDIAIEVGHDDDVEGFGRVGHFSGTDVDDPEFFFKFGIFSADLIEDLVKQAVGELHDVVFGEAGNFFAIVLAGVFKGVTDDFFGAGAGDEFEALVDFVGLTVFDAGVEILFVFADDD